MSTKDHIGVAGLIDASLFIQQALVGIALGWWLLGGISEVTARRVIGVCVLMEMQWMHSVPLEAARRYRLSDVTAGASGNEGGES